MVINDFVSFVVHAALSAVWIMDPTKSDANKTDTRHSTCHRRPAKDLSQRLIIIASTWQPDMGHQAIFGCWRGISDDIPSIADWPYLPFENAICRQCHLLCSQTTLLSSGMEDSAP